MQSLQKAENPVEVKMLGRYSHCDLNVMLLYSFFVIKFDNDGTDFLDEKFDRDFISNCFYCGCTSGQSGVSISYFIIQKASFAVLARQIKQNFPHEKKSYLTAIVRNLLTILLNGLRVDNKDSEKILICDEEYRFITLSRKPVSNRSINTFIKSFSFFYFLKAKRLVRRPDNFSMLYNAIKKKLGKDIKIYYTLYGDTYPNIPDTTILDNFIFCKKECRLDNGCKTKSYIRNTIPPRNSENRKLKDLYDFVGL